MAGNDAVVRVYDPHAEIEAIIKDLQRSSCAINRLSIVGKDYHKAERVIGCANACDGKKAWDKLGCFWGGLSGLLLGSGFYSIPGVGPIMVFGPLVGWIATALEDAVMSGELSALGAGLHSMGISKPSIMEYETALKYDKFLAIAHGRTNDMAKAKTVLRSTGAAQITAMSK